MTLQSSRIIQFRSNLIGLHRWLKVALMLSADMIALPLCFLVAMLLRLGDFYTAAKYGLVPYLLVAWITIPVFMVTGLYRAVIRFIDQKLLTSAGIGLALAILFAYAIELFFNDQRLPHTALIIYWFIAFSYVVSSRLTIRAFLRQSAGEGRLRQNIVAIYGAGEAGAQLVAAMRANRQYEPVCFFDEEEALQNRSVAGLRVFHTDYICDLSARLGIGLIVLAIPAASPAYRRRIMHNLIKAGVPIRTLNNLIDLKDDEINAREIREIRLEDLLGRDPVPVQLGLFAKCIQGKNVLVTGAGGSIGSELCRQIMTLGPCSLHLLDHSEFALYTINEELRDGLPNFPLQAHLGSVCDAGLVERIMRSGQIDTVYHAAAYKHLPLVEINMAEGIRNNVVGAQVVAVAARKNHVKTCVLISTDKAVRPTNIMGASKRIAELIFQASAVSGRSETTYSMVRFGNVLGSSGSVVPLFKKQIEAGGPITITHPDVVRYFMLIPEAAQLVLQAGAMAKGGEVFVLDMGEPIKIIDLARTMIEMAGLIEKTVDEPHGDIEITCVGLRPGEKMYEELLIGDNAVGSHHPRIMCASEAYIEPLLLNRMLNDLIAACERNDEDRISFVLNNIVVEYNPQKNPGGNLDASQNAFYPPHHAMRQ